MSKEKIMQVKYHANFADMPKYLKKYIFDMLDEKTQSNLALVNKMFGHSICQKDRIKNKLFALAGRGEQDKIKEILEICPELLLISAPLKDISGIELIIDSPYAAAFINCSS